MILGAYITTCGVIIAHSSPSLPFPPSRDESEYNLHLAFDINTDRHTQWFYFRMSNLRKGRAYKLNMQNLMKTEAVYNLGMQPIAYSQVWCVRCFAFTRPWCAQCC